MTDEETPSPLPSSDDYAHEIISKVGDFETAHSSQLGDFNKFYRQYRAVATRIRSENQSNTFLPEMFVEIEALATACYEMFISDNSGALFFDIVGEGAEDRARAIVTKATMSKQMEENELESKILPFFRMLALNGTQPVEMNWVLQYKSYWDNLARVRRPALDVWDFDPFSIVNYAFDDTAAETERQEWDARTRHVSPQAAKQMVRKGVWNAAAVEAALAEGQKHSTYQTQQKRDAGYTPGFESPGITAYDYFGTLSGMPEDEDGETYWAVVSSGGHILKPAEINPFNHGEKSRLVAKWISLIDEPYGVGIGHINTKQQAEINDRRNFINDMLLASLYNMWMKRSDAGLSLPGGVLKWSPHKIIEADGISEEFLRALRPDMAGLSSAVNLESSDRETMRRNSGATTTLQAIATGITATEATAIQSEATRRVKAIMRSQISTFFKRVLYRAHALNMQFLDRAIVARWTNESGEEVYGPASREDQLVNPDIRMKTTLDLDFRPFRRKELLEMLDIFSRLEKSGISGRRILPDPIIEELATTYGMNPRKFFTKDMVLETQTRAATQSPEIQQRAMQEILAESPGAQQVLQNGGVNA